MENGWTWPISFHEFYHIPKKKKKNMVSNGIVRSIVRIFSLPRCHWSAPARTPACSAAWPPWQQRRPPSPSPRGTRCPGGSGCANHHLRGKKVEVFHGKWWCGLTLWKTMNDYVKSKMFFFEVFQGILPMKRLDCSAFQQKEWISSKAKWVRGDGGDRDGDSLHSKF